MSWLCLNPKGEENGRWQCGAADASFIRILVGEYCGNLFLTTNSGQSWNAVAQLQERNWQGAAMSTDGQIMVAIAWGGELYVSSDGGSTWMCKDEEMRPWQTLDISDDGKYILVATTDGHVVLSSDYGQTFNQLSISEEKTWWNRACLNANGSLMLLCAPGENKVVYSNDYGTTWNNVEGLSDLKVHTITLANNDQDLLLVSKRLQKGSFNDGEVSDIVELQPLGDQDKYWYELLVSPNNKTAAITVDGNVVYSSDTVMWEDVTPELAPSDSADWRVLVLSYDGSKILTASWEGKAYLITV